jgi:UDP-N-acetyl-D-glucosamine dehydrogenase
MPHLVVHNIGEALNSQCQSLNGSRVLVAGIAYKRDIDDIRESPALDVMNLLHEKGAKPSYADP